MIYFDPTTGGFLDSTIHQIPDSAVEITPSIRADLLAGEAAGLAIAIGPDGYPYLQPFPINTEDLCRAIDGTADKARRTVAGDPLRAVEYDRARIEAQTFAEAGYPADAVPRTVAAWAINGRTAQQAANSILVEAAAYTEALYVIRETRLAAKEQIRMLMDAGEVEQAQQVVEQTVATIEAAVSGVGNAY